MCRTISPTCRFSFQQPYTHLNAIRCVCVPVCMCVQFIASGVRFAGLSDIPQSFWSTGSGGDNTCTCGTLQRCGGTRSYSQQRATWVEMEVLVVAQKGEVWVLRCVFVFWPLSPQPMAKGIGRGALSSVHSLPPLRLLDNNNYNNKDKKKETLCTTSTLT